MTHTIEQRDDRGPLAYRRRERLDRIVEVESLATQQHCVKLVLDGVRLDDWRILQCYVAVRAFDHEACGGKLRGTARPHQKGDVAAGLQHPAAEVSANGPRANDENSHLSIPVVAVKITGAAAGIRKQHDRNAGFVKGAFERRTADLDVSVVLQSQSPANRLTLGPNPSHGGRSPP